LVEVADVQSLVEGLGVEAIVIADQVDLVVTAVRAQEVRERFLQRPARHAIRAVKYHFVQAATSQCTAARVLTKREIVTSVAEHGVSMVTVVIHVAKDLRTSVLSVILVLPQLPLLPLLGLRM
jgi:hypothetical protein